MVILYSFSAAFCSPCRIFAAVPISSAAFCRPCRIPAAVPISSAASMPDSLKLVQWFHHLASATLSDLLFHWLKRLCFHLKSRNITELFVFCITDLLCWFTQPVLDLLDSLSITRSTPYCPNLGTAILQQTDKNNLCWVNTCHVVCYITRLSGAETGKRAYLRCTTEPGAKVAELMPTKIALDWETV